MIPKNAVSDALALLPASMDTPAARVQLYAICLQESLGVHRRQLVGNPPQPVGPAKGLWQFERGGGCIGVVNHPASRSHMSAVCAARGIDFTSASIWNALEFDDVLAAAAARLLLWTDPVALPTPGTTLGAITLAWDYYVRTWRPGAWERGSESQKQALRAKWAKNYAAAVAAV